MKFCVFFFLIFALSCKKSKNVFVPTIGRIKKKKKEQLLFKVLSILTILSPPFLDHFLSMQKASGLEHVKTEDNDSENISVANHLDGKPALKLVLR